MYLLQLDLPKRSVIAVERDIDIVDLEAAIVDCAGSDMLTVALAPDEDVRMLSTKIDRVAAIVVSFASFTDGRAYSQVRLLRARLGFSGDIIARGDILRDQLVFMARCGVNLVEGSAECAEAFADALGEATHFYQRASDEAEPVFAKRAARAKAARQAAA